MQSAVARLVKIPGIGETKAKELYRAGARNKTDLRKPDIYKLLPRETKFNLRYNIAKNVTKSDVSYLTSLLPSALTLVGSGRRGVATSRDIDYLTTKPLNDVVEQIRASSLELLGQLNFGQKRRSIIVKTPRDLIVKLDIFKTEPRYWPFALLHHTGSKEFSIRIRAHAKRSGYKLSQYGLFTKTGRRVSGLNTERAILQKIGVTYKPPSER